MPERLLGSEKDFTDETFEGLDCREMVFKDKEFQDCNFVRCSFAQVEFVRCRFLDCEFDQCDLSNINVKNSTLRGVQFLSCKMIGVNWTEASALHQLKFKSSVLNFSVFSGLDLRKVEISSCVAHDLDLAQTNLSEAVLQKSEFRGTRFNQTNLTKADLRGAKDYAIHPSENLLKKTRFSLPEATALLYQLDIVLDD